MALGVLSTTAVTIALLWTATDGSSGGSSGGSPGGSSGAAGAAGSDDPHNLLDLSLSALRACIGTDNLSPEPDNGAHQALATVASVTGALVPAVLVGIAMVKVFSVRPFVWREKASISPATTVDFAAYAAREAGTDNAVIAVRFYNKFDNLTVVDLRARAHLRFLERSPHDGSLVIYKKALKVLDEKGEPADERYWLTVERGAPFTVWIPLDAPAPALPFTEIQGKDLTASEGVKLLVRITARTVMLGTEVADDRWFDLSAADFELGRFVPLRPDLTKDVWDWDGWTAFEHTLPPAPAPSPLPPPPAPGAPPASADQQPWLGGSS
ncbi:MAG: hypothetical protein HOY69_26230 [Streptomyces sp.]|nr:hypothetical protein [Streptomyces sp.]